MSTIGAAASVQRPLIADRFYATTPAEMEKQVQEMNAKAILTIARFNSGEMSAFEIRQAITELTREANYTAKLLKHAVPSDFQSGKLEDYKSDHATVIRLIGNLKDQIFLPGVPRQSV
jgi:hypothetical protein